MATLREIYPQTWGELECAQAERVAKFLEETIQDARTVRKADVRKGYLKAKDMGYMWHDIRLEAPLGAAEILRRTFPGKFSFQEYVGCPDQEVGHFYVNKVKVQYSTRNDPGGDSYRVRYYDFTKKSWRLYVPAEPLNEAQLETYVQLRKDYTKATQALELAKMLVPEL